MQELPAHKKVRIPLDSRSAEPKFLLVPICIKDEGTIDLGKDKQPSYQVDGIPDQIYCRPSSTAIVSYRF